MTQIHDLTYWTSYFFSQGRIQLFIDAIDHDVRQLGQGDTIIAYGINLELQLGEGFTQRATYVSQVWIQVRSINIDLSFKVRCSENYYGPSCGKVCRPVEGVSTCDQDGNVTSLNEIICTLHNFCGSVHVSLHVSACMFFIATPIERHDRLDRKTQTVIKINNFHHIPSS